MSPETPSQSAFRKDTLLYIAAWFLMQFCFLGIYSVLVNLYLIRLGYDTRFIGTVNALIGAAFAAACFPAGIVGKKFGYRKVIRFALGCNIFVSSLLPLSLYASGASRATLILVGYSLYSVLTTLIAVNGVPYLAGAVDENDRGRILAANSAAAPAAGFFGSVAGGALPGVFSRHLSIPLDQPAPYGLPFWIVPVLYAITFVAFSFTSDDQHVRGGQKSETKSPIPLKTIGMIFLFITLRVSLNHTVLTYFNVYMDSAFAASAATIGIYLAVSRVVSAPASFIAPGLMRRLGRRGTVFVTGIAAVIAALPLGLVNQVVIAGFSVIAVLGINAMFEVSFTTLQQESVSPEWRPLASGAVFTAAGFGYALVALIGGVIAGQIGFRKVFLIMNGVSLVGMLLFIPFFGLRTRSQR